MEHNERFEQIYAETRDDLLRYLMVRTNAAPEAEDLFQEVYRRFYLRLSRSVVPILDPRRYLFSVAKKVLARHYLKAATRKSTEQPITEDLDVASEDDPIDERLLLEERKAAVWQVLSDEPDLNRRAFILFYGYDRSQADIGKSLGISEQAVRQRLYRTRLRIRALLGSDPDEL